MKKQLVILVFMFMSVVATAQKKYKAHEVQKGETLYSLAIKYNTSVKKLLKYNPDISKETELEVGKLLVIPTKQKTITTADYDIHLVRKRETLFGLSRKYNVTEEAIQKANPILAKKGMMCGLELRIPTKIIPTNPPETLKDIIANNAIKHIVEKGETIYSITHQYGITEAQLRANNPQIEGNELPLGMVLLITKDTTTGEQLASTVKIDTIFTKHLVLPKETVYSITHLYEIDKEQLIKLNPNYPALKDNVLHPDDVLIVKQLIIKKDSVTNAIDSVYVGLKKPLLTRVIPGKQLRVGLLFPLNLKAYNYSNTDSLQQEIKENKGLNRVLDFYNGSRMALDSVAALGVKVDATVFDTESKKSVALLQLIREGKLTNKNVLIGPFFTENVALVAENVQNDSVVIVAPFNKKALSYPQVLNARIAKDKETVKMLDFMVNNYTDENIIYIDDETDDQAKAAVLLKFPKTKILKVDKETKAISFEGIAKALDLDEEGELKDNKKPKDAWVIVNSNKDWFIGSVVSAFSSLQGKVKITLFSTKKYKAFTEINPNHLANLDYHFPSLTNIDNEDAVFNKKYMQRFGVRPSIMALKGFDMTLDALLRASVAGDLISEDLLYESNKGIISQFQYRKTTEGSYQNEAVQILKYTKDLHQVNAVPIKKEVILKVE